MARDFVSCERGQVWLMAPSVVEWLPEDHLVWTVLGAVDQMDMSRSYSGVVREILREAEETDRREDELYGDARGDELPEQLRTAEGRKAALADTKRRIEERKGRQVGPQEPEQDVEVDPELVL